MRYPSITLTPAAAAAAAAAVLLAEWTD